MSEKEMDRMDREVMALVNERDKRQEEEVPCGNGPETELQEELTGSADALCNDAETEQVDQDVPLKKENGKYVLTEEQYQKLAAEVKSDARRRTRIRVAACATTAGVLLLTFMLPQLLPWMVSIGVISCSVAIGIAVDRLIQGR